MDRDRPRTRPLPELRTDGGGGVSESAMRNWVWLALLWLAAMSGLWAGLSGGYPPAVLALFMSWVLGLTWLVACRKAGR